MKRRRIKAMRAFVGIRKADPEAPDAVETVRSLRRDDRLDRLGKLFEDPRVHADFENDHEAERR
jgi:hypothetical protein